MRLNGLTYECIRPSVQNYINQYFCGSIACVRMRKIDTKIARVNGPLVNKLGSRMAGPNKAPINVTKLCFNWEVELCEKE